MSRDLHILRAAFAVLSITAFAVPASAAIPDSERATLLALYNSTNGAGWTENDGWSGAAGTECDDWYGISCNGARDHVTAINLFNNNLIGTLPDLSSLTALEYFHASGNQLTGPIPSLSHLTSLQGFVVDANQLTGAIPTLSGLTSLRIFVADFNQLTGPIPGLSGLTTLETFGVSNNQLTGSIPDLSELPSLQYLYVGANQLTGTIPNLSGVPSLQTFSAYYNQLTGPIPDLSSLTSLRYFVVDGNQLSGHVPDLSGSTSLRYFVVDGNQLIGPIPDLSSLTSLAIFRIQDNQLTGTPPAAPPSLLAGYSGLCPNFLHTPSPTDTAWDIATGETPWSQNCTPGYLVTPMAGKGGSIMPALPHAVVSGEMDTLTITPNAGYAVQFVGGSCGGNFDNSDGTYVTLPITQDCTVTASFFLVADVIFRDGFDS